MSKRFGGKEIQLYSWLTNKRLRKNPSPTMAGLVGILE